MVKMIEINYQIERIQKMTKKFIVLLTVFSLVFTVSACGTSTAKPYDYDLSEYVTLGDYIGVEVEKVEPAAVTDEAVEQEIMSRLEENASTETFEEGAVENGVTANIDYEGKVDGEVFEGGSAEGFDLIIGSGQFIEGFESGLVGKKVGETVTLNLKFPDEYSTNPDMAGKDVVFTVKINSFSKEIVPELNEEFIKSVSDAKTVEDYKKLVKAELEVQAEETAKQTMTAAAWEAVYENAEILKYPEKELGEKEQEMKDYYNQYTEAYGMSMEDFLTMAGMTEEEFNDEAKSYAETSVGEELIMYAITRAEGIEITDEEYTAGAEEYALSLGFVDDEGKADVAAMEEYYTKETIESSLLWEKFFDFILDNAKIVEPKANNEEDGVEKTEE